MDAGAGAGSTEGFWQSFSDGPDTADPPYVDRYAVRIAERKYLSLPIRVLPDGRDRAVASLILTQASFDVVEGVSEAMAELARPFRPEVIVGLPTLGLAVAPLVARRLGFSNYVALGYSRKFWYRDELSVSVSSITSPGGGKRLYLDPNVLTRLDGRRALLVDDVVARGTTVAAARRLLAAASTDLVGGLVAMAQTGAWRKTLPDFDLRAVFASPLLERRGAGWWPIAD
jgi:adenine/guanine phosphoribosyltransferase-like PRPP-binding protein